MTEVRREKPSDVPAIRTVLCEAFPTEAEADLVDRLRSNGNLSISLVAVDSGQVVGHIGFSPVFLNRASTCGAGLAPVAVRPSHQRLGVGGQLISAGLEKCRDLGVGFVVVLGEPGYYHLFGFEPACTFGLENEYDVVDEFMAIELVDDGLSGITGLVQFGSEFEAFS